MITAWIGLIVGFGSVLLGQMLEGGHIDSLIQPTAGLIVFGGTLGATMLSSSLQAFSGAVRSLGKVFLGKDHDLGHVAKEIITLANVARKDGVLGLEKLVKDLKNPFLQSNLRHIVDGYDPVAVKEMMETRIGKEEEERTAVVKVWETAGGFSPTVGIIGAVLGLIHVMSNLSDSSKLGAGIAVAFVATVYGVASANLLFLPVANKLKAMAHHDMLEFEMIYTGLLSIQSGLNPRIIEDKMFNIIGEHSVAEKGGEKKAA